MLRKLFAKLRKTVAPDAGARPQSAQSPARPAARPSPAPSKPAHGGHSASRSATPSGGRDGGRHPRRGHGGEGRQASRPAASHAHHAPRTPEPEKAAARPPAPRAAHTRAHEPAPPPPAVPAMDTVFSKLGLADSLAFAVQEMGYAEPTPIQAQAIPLALTGRDLIGSAQTGTGKTAAFALPILQRLQWHGAQRCLILEPTRELALQVEEAFLKFAKFTNLRVTIVYGGVGYGKQLEDLHRGVDILVATPGRLLDHLEQRNTTLNDISMLVLDEVDRMLDMGFLPDVRRIVQQCPRERQTLFFTATMPPEIESLAGWALREPVKIEIGHRRSPAETVAHAFYPVVDSQKFDLLSALLERTQYRSVLVFSRTKFGADRIARRLKTLNHSVAALHSDRSQRERIEALEGFKSGQFEVLVATDIAARGLDIAGVSHVINYDVPENPEDYVHRIGRTGRAQHTGEAFTLVTEDQVRNARSIERFIGAAIERKKIDGFDYIYSALFDEKALADVAPKPVSRLHRGLRR